MQVQEWYQPDCNAGQYVNPGVQSVTVDQVLAFVDTLEAKLLQVQ